MKTQIFIILLFLMWSLTVSAQVSIEADEMIDEALDTEFLQIEWYIIEDWLVDGATGWHIVSDPLSYDGEDALISSEQALIQAEIPGPALLSFYGKGGNSCLNFGAYVNSNWRNESVSFNTEQWERRILELPFFSNRVNFMLGGVTYCDDETTAWLDKVELIPFGSCLD